MASRSLGSLTLSLILQYGGFEKGLDASARTADKRMKEIEARAKKFGAFLGTTIAAAGGAAAAGVVAVTKEAIDFADHLNDLKERLGISAEALSGWAYAAKQAGTDIDALAIGLRRLSANMADALDPKSQQAGLFKALGVEVKDASGNLRSLEDVLPEIAQKFKEMDNATTETALAMELFGKSGSDLLEFLNQGQDGLEELRQKARELGVEINDNTLQAADKFKDGLSDLKTIGLAAGLQLAEKLLPAMTSLVEEFRSGVTEGGAFGKVIAWIGDQAEAAVADFKQLKSDLEDFKAIFNGFAAQAESVFGVLKNIATLDFSGAKKSLLELLVAREDTFAALGKDRFQFANVTGGSTTTEVPQDAPKKAVPDALSRFLGGSSGSRSKARTGKTEEQRELEQLQASYDSLNGRMREQIALFGMTGESAKVRYDIEHGELQKLSETQKQALTEQAGWLDWLQEMADIESVWKDVNQEVTDQAITNMRRMQEEAELTKAAFVDAFRFEGANAIADFVTGVKSAKDAAKDFFDNMGRMITQMISEQWMQKLFGGIGTTGEGTTGGDWVGSIFGALFGGGKATGGPVSAGMFYRVNENGPELLSVSGRDYLMMGEQAGKVTPNNRLAFAGTAGPMQMTQNIVVQGRPTRETMYQLERATAQAAARSMRRG
jgi:hypothetical protein